MRIFLILFCLLSTTVHATSLPKLEKDQGYFIFAYSGNYPPNYVSIGTREVFSSYETIGDFKLPQGYRIIVMDEGQYRFSRLKLSTRADYYKLKDIGFDFHIEAGKINYSGHLMFEYIHYNKRVSSKMVNHTSQAYTWLNENTPQLLEDYELKYIGLGIDDFMNFYSAQ